MMTNQRFVCCAIYRGEGQLLFVPLIKHLGAGYVDSKKIIILEDGIQCKEIGGAIFRGRGIIDETKPSEETNAELKDRLLWKLYSKCKSGSQFYKKYLHAHCVFYENGEYAIYSSKKIGGGYGGSIKEIRLSSDATMEEIGKAVIVVLDAAEEYYQDKATEYIYPTKVVELFDNSKLTIKHPKDSHFVDSEDCHTAEIYQCYSYLSSEGTEASAEFLVGIGAEINCDLSCDNVKASWEKYYGEAESFEMCEEDLGIFKYRVEFKNKGIHKISYFLKMQEDLLLECSMNLYKPNKRKKLDEKLTEMFGKFVMGCKFK